MVFIGVNIHSFSSDRLRTFQGKNEKSFLMNLVLWTHPNSRPSLAPLLSQRCCDSVPSSAHGGSGLEAPCQAFTVLGKPSAVTGPSCRKMPPFIGGVPVTEWSNPPNLLTCLSPPSPLLFNWNCWLQAVRRKINELWMNWIFPHPPPEIAI